MSTLETKPELTKISEPKEQDHFKGNLSIPVKEWWQETYTHSFQSTLTANLLSQEELTIQFTCRKSQPDIF